MHAEKNEIISAAAEIAKEKGIDKEVVSEILEEVFSGIVKKKYGEDVETDIVTNVDRGEIEIYVIKDIVENVENPGKQISLEAVRQIEPDGDFDIGDQYPEEVSPEELGRRLVVFARQTFLQRLHEYEKNVIYDEYNKMIGEIVVGEIYQVKRDFILVNHNRRELFLPRSEQISNEHYRKNSTVRAVVKEVRKGTSGPQVIISRADPMFLKKLFEMEIPEIFDGVVEIRAIARDPGKRAKVAVLSTDSRVDAVGACVGMKGVRIHSIVRELNNENIDVLLFSEEPAMFVERSLTPAKVTKVTVDLAGRKAQVWVDNNQESIAIGKEGINVKLASRLTGFDIDLMREGVAPESKGQGREKQEAEEYDIDLSEFKEELGEELLTKFLDAGYLTARNVLDATEDEIRSDVDIPVEEVQRFKEMMRKELEEEPENESQDE
ncbi:MAG: transcription termination factor NusA [Bacteroidetes bacterium]|jgi:N utilization substance protein A|nr:transcription termination factor NusA [Bacteroidota bacterium]MCL5034002.1 transcription termination factor NusA [Bacteroidota bacterium]